MDNQAQGDRMQQVKACLAKLHENRESLGVSRQRYALSERDGHLEWAVGEIERLRNILKMIAEMPASTHAIDAELCREALS